MKEKDKVLSFYYSGVSVELSMMYAGSKNQLVKFDQNDH